MMFSSAAEARRAGSDDANRDIAAGKPRLHFEARGAWGQDLKDTMLSQFGVEVIALSCFWHEVSSAYTSGYDAVVKAHLEERFGPCCVEAAWREVQERRQQMYDEWVAKNSERLQ